MEIRDKKVMVLGGYGEVGFAIWREFLLQELKELIVTSLRIVMDPGEVVGWILTKENLPGLGPTLPGLGDKMAVFSY